MLDINNLENFNNPLDTIIEEINSIIFSKEKWIDNEFYKIPEMTYSYEKVWENNEYIINKTLFSDLGDLDIEEFKNVDCSWKKELITKAWNTVRSKILEKIEKIEKYLQNFDKIDWWNNEVLKARKEIIVWGLLENITFLNIALEWLDFEKEKAILWIYFKLENNKNSDFYIGFNKRKEKLEKINILNTEVFWEKISNNKEYIEWNLDYLFDKFEDYKKELKLWKIEEKRLLSESEKIRYNYYIAKLQWLSSRYKPKKREKPESVIDKKWKEIKIDIKDLKNNLNHNLIAIDKQSWNMPHRAYFDKDISCFTDTYKWIAIPDNSELKFKSAYDVVRLIWHESEQHSVSQVSHEQLVWNIRWKQNLEVVEWAAMLWEELFEYWENMYTYWFDKNWKQVKIIDLEKISYVQSFPKTIMEEILTDEEFFDFLELQHKIEPNKMSPLDRYLRFKRTGFQRKDITYTTWKLKVAKYYNDIITWKIDGNFSDLYLWKVWFDDINHIKTIKNNIDKKNEKLNEESKIKLPENLFFAESTYFSVIKKEKWEKVTSENFYNYLQKKYPPLNITKQKIDSISFWFKKQLLWIVNNLYLEVDIYNKRKEVKKKKQKRY